MSMRKRRISELIHFFDTLILVHLNILLLFYALSFHQLREVGDRRVNAVRAIPDVIPCLVRLSFKVVVLIHQGFHAAPIFVPPCGTGNHAR